MIKSSYKQFFIVLFIGIFTKEAFASKFSEEAWKSIDLVYAQIVKHPFNQELARGTLDKKIFQFYKNQDAYYLRKFSKALSLLASKLEDISDIRMVLKHSSNSFDEDLSNVKLDLKGVSPSNFSYTHFLLSTASFGTKEELVAALLPCYWIYLKVALDLKKKSTSKSPFYSWIKLYSSKRYADNVNAMIKLTDKLAMKATPELRKKMLLAFKLASKLELNFWDDSYYQREIL